MARRSVAARDGQQVFDHRPDPRCPSCSGLGAVIGLGMGGPSRKAKIHLLWPARAWPDDRRRRASGLPTVHDAGDTARLSQLVVPSESTGLCCLGLWTLGSGDRRPILDLVAASLARPAYLLLGLVLGHAELPDNGQCSKLLVLFRLILRPLCFYLRMDGSRPPELKQPTFVNLETMTAYMNSAAEPRHPRVTSAVDLPKTDVTSSSPPATNKISSRFIGVFRRQSAESLLYSLPVLIHQPESFDAVCSAIAPILWVQCEVRNLLPTTKASPRILKSSCRTYRQVITW